MKRKTQTINWLFAITAFIVIAGFGAVNAQKMKAPEFHVVNSSKYSFDDTVDLLKGAIEAQNLMVLKEIDAQKMLRMVEVKTKGMKQLLFFHPRYMKKIMKANKHAMIEPPLKIAIMEKPDGKVMIKYLKPSYLLGKYDGLEAIGKELDELVATIVGDAQK